MDSNQLGPFTLLEKLGEGGMGVVYKARDTRLDRLVAIKLLPESRLADSDRRARFIQEARAASALNHPGIVTIHEIGEQDGRHYMVMELIDGKPLQDLIPRKGMRLIEALRIAVQVADAVSAAHAAGIVHRDLKPGNIMVDASGRAKVLDFGLAKLTAPSTTSDAVGEDTPTIVMNAHTEEGMIVGSLPYMSPEQAEGRPVDARSDIFSFGAVLYEMITGQRAFQGESRISTLAAVVDRDPQPVSEAVPGAPPELEKVIARCLRKDVARRSQHISDVKLALEELRDESVSGVLARPSSGVAPAMPAGRRWLWPAIAAVFALLAMAAGWMLLRRGPSSARPAAPHLVRVSPDDGYSYTSPTISPDGKLVAFVSDRGGSKQVWLRQVGGGDPIQVTHSADPVNSVAFFPDGTRLLLQTGGQNPTPQVKVEIVPTFGGTSRVLAVAEIQSAAVSPDGRQVAYLDFNGRQYQLHVVSTDGGDSRVLEKWAAVQARAIFTALTWTSESRYLLAGGSKHPGAATLDEWDWFVIPVDGGDPIPTGAGDAIRAVGAGISAPGAISRDRLLFAAGSADRFNSWELRLTPGTWRVSGPPRQLTFGTDPEAPASVSATGTAAIQIARSLSDFYLIPTAADTGQPTGPARRLTQDGRRKRVYGLGGDPGFLYFHDYDFSGGGLQLTLFSLDLASTQQTELYRKLAIGSTFAMSPDGRQFAYTQPEGDRFVVRAGTVGEPVAAARLLPRDCGQALRYSPDGRYLVCFPEARAHPDPKQKRTTALMEVATGKLTPWLVDDAESVLAQGFMGIDWVLIRTVRPGEESTRRDWVARWHPEPIPRSEWMEIKPLQRYSYSNAKPFLYAFDGSRLMAQRFDAKQRRLSEPFEIHIPPGSPVDLRPSDTWSVRGPGITFEHRENFGSVWLMKLPE